jgi:hypothetical protein
MTFAEQEAAGGNPVECYVFGSGAAIWYYTSAELEITLPAWPSNPFVPAPIIREAIDQSSEDASGSMHLTVPRTFPPIAAFIPYAPANRISVLMAQAHRGHEVDYITPFRGRILSVAWEDSLAKVECCGIGHELQRGIPRLGYYRQCNLALYSTVCSVEAALFRQEITVIEVNGADIVATGFSLHPDGWFNAGWIEWGDQKRFIVNHVANTVTLMNPFPGLSGGGGLVAYAGCNHTEADCKDKFDNLANHLGFANVPWRDPHLQRIT